ncbi:MULTISPECIES: hypothetical protein [Cyanophyceae]|uniref:hypothetical protein n=1 Tax=Cyanophyceae TaxID=3028117 RepID=UPI001688BEF8|nr:hypothetical protein [Trichocoleus sp. FACHB-40]MBD2004515.1 hypothetical protein [Trichocoleus sp. FACHB-40]
MLLSLDILYSSMSDRASTCSENLARMRSRCADLSVRASLFEVAIALAGDGGDRC